MEATTKAPLMYNGWEEKRKKSVDNKYCAYNYRTDIFINPLYETWGTVKNCYRWHERLNFPQNKLKQKKK